MVAGHLSKKSGRWYLVIELRGINGNRKPKWLSTGLPVKGNKRRAEELLYQKRVEYTAVQHCQKNSGEMLFSDYLSGWQASRKSELAQATFDSYAFILNNQVIPYYRERQSYLSKLLPQDIAAYHQFLFLREVSPNTVIRHHAVIHKALEDAVYRELIPANPAARVRRPKKEVFITKPYTVEECRQLLNAVQGEKIELAVTLALYTGMRRSELLGLRWGAIDFGEKLIHINHAIVRGVIDKKYTGVGQDKLKRESSSRTLPLTEPLYTKLCEAITCRYGTQLPPPNEYVLAGKDGKALKPNYLTEAFTKLLKKHGLRPIRLHDLRHSCSNLLITARVPLIEVQQWLGHSSIQTTANLYSHLTYETKLNSAETIKNFNEERGNNMKKSEKMTIAEWIVELDTESIKNVRAFLETGVLQSLTESDEGCYDAIIQFDNKDPLFVEVSLDANDCIEDLHCTCNTGFCVHLAAVLHEIKTGHAILYCESEK